VTIFSRQVKEDALKLSQLPPAFAAYLSQWSMESSIPAVTTRYFIGGLDKKILLEHDEDYCAPADGSPAVDCEMINADAADTDLNAAYYLEQTNHATNATAWMIVGPDQIAWIQVRNNACGIGPDRVLCRIRMTRERTRVIIHRHSVPQLPRR
ncbi:MAG: lysozyme inhibitor LprI family protein, partial [Candidatus Sulfotelmatobacter sp.]